MGTYGNRNTVSWPPFESNPLLQRNMSLTRVAQIDAGWPRLLATFGNLCSYIKWQLFANIYSLPEIAISDCSHSK